MNADVATTVTELGVSVEDFSGDKPKTKLKCHNPKLRIFREFVLATLSTLAEIKSKHVFAKSDKEQTTPSQVYALDALACTGIAGIQWKKHLSSLVHVTLADDLKQMVDNAHANAFSCTEQKLNPLRAAGDLVEPQGEKELHYCQADAKALLMMEAYNFIYLSSSKTCASYFEAAMHSMKSDGFLCVTVPDISLFARSPHVVQRFYSADVVKTEYLKELAARIVLASLARAAARCLKGIMPQYVVSHEDHLLVCVKVNKSHKSADSSIHEIEKLLHCRLCEERVFMPNQLAPYDDPYSLLSCSCKKNNPGKTAVILGPVWKGHISDSDFLNHLQRHGRQLNLSPKCLELVNLLIKECMCAKSGIFRTAEPSSQPSRATAEDESKDFNSSQKETNVSSAALSEAVENKSDIKRGEDVSMDQAETADHVETSLTVTEAEIANGTAHAKEDNQEAAETDTAKLKRKAEDGHPDELNSTKSKRQKKADVPTKSVNVPFYYNVTKFKKTNLPKLDKLVTILHCRGHRASRTHFDSCAIRTSASVEEFLHICG